VHGYGCCQIGDETIGDGQTGDGTRSVPSTRVPRTEPFTGWTPDLLHLRRWRTFPDSRGSGTFFGGCVARQQCGLARRKVSQALACAPTAARRAPCAAPSRPGQSSARFGGLTAPAQPFGWARFLGGRGSWEGEAPGRARLLGGRGSWEGEAPAEPSLTIIRRRRPARGPLHPAGAEVARPSRPCTRGTRLGGRLALPCPAARHRRWPCMAAFGHVVAVVGSQGRQPLESNTIPRKPAPAGASGPCGTARGLPSVMIEKPRPTAWAARMGPCSSGFGGRMSLILILSIAVLVLVLDLCLRDSFCPLHPSIQHRNDTCQMRDGKRRGAHGRKSLVSLRFFRARARARARVPLH